MDLKKNLGTNISMLFLLGLTIIAAGVYYVTNGAIEKIETGSNNAEINSLMSL